MESKSNYTFTISHRKHVPSTNQEMLSNTSLPEMNIGFVKSSQGLIMSPTSEESKEISKSVANCIRGLNATIDVLIKENTQLRKNSEDQSSKKGIENNGEIILEGKCKKVQEINERLTAQINEFKVKNLDLKEKYERVKEMYNILAEKPNKFERLSVISPAGSEITILKQKNKNLAALNQKCSIEIENLKSKLNLSRQTILEYKNNQQALLDQKQKSERFVNELVDLNDQLITCMKKKGYRKSSRHKVLRTEESTQSSIISKFEHEIRKLNHKYEEIRQNEMEKPPAPPQSREFPEKNPSRLKSAYQSQHKLKLDLTLSDLLPSST